MKFNELFEEAKPIIGMIHLFGRNRHKKVIRALEELHIYEEEEIDGAIIENYHGSPTDVLEILKQTQGKFKNVIIGVNVLNNPYSSFNLAQDYGARFVQFDSVQTTDLNLELYKKMRIEFPDIVVLGGVGFKYTSPTGNLLEIDLKEGKSICEAIVTTGTGTGVETPSYKLRQYKGLLRDFPLVVGAGVNIGNAYEQLGIVDGAIIGSYFKPDGITKLPVERQRVKNLMDIVKEVRDISELST